MTNVYQSWIVTPTMEQRKEGKALEYFKYEMLNDHLYRIHGVTDEQMYLVIGSEKALLVDTGCGVGDLRGLCESLTEKPITVVLTHGHVDHAMGAIQFGNVYMNHLDDAIYNGSMGAQMQQDYLRMTPDFQEEMLQDLQDKADVHDFNELSDGDAFDLGGLNVNVYSCPSHTPGSMCVLLREDRILITGDACNPFTFLFFDESAGIATYRKNVEALSAKTKGTFDRVFYSHGAVEGNEGVLEEAVELCDDIVNGRTDDLPFEFAGQKACIAKAMDEQMNRLDGKMINVVYRKTKVNE